MHKEFIWKCYQAKELQRDWKPKLGDLIYTPSSSFKRCFNIVGTDISSEEVEKLKQETLVIWLPTQEQIQEMLYEYCPRWVGLAIEFGYWVANFTSAEDETTTIPELWLMFLMFKKYNKIWSEDISFAVFEENKWKVYIEGEDYE